MSNIVTEFNPATSDSTSFVAPQSASSGALVFWNESNISLNLTFGDGSTLYLPAWFSRHKCGATGNVKVAWVIRTILASDNPPTSEIIVEAFDNGEHYPADGPLVRQTNGGVVTTNTITASSVSNHADAMGTKEISITDVGDPAGDTVAIDNIGNATFGNAQHTGSMSAGDIYGGASKQFHVDTIGRAHIPEILFAAMSSSMQGWKTVSGTGPGVFTHGCTDNSGAAATPDAIIPVPTGASGQPYAVGESPPDRTNTTFKIATNAAQTWYVLIIKF